MALDYEKEQFYNKYGRPKPGQELVGMGRNRAIYRDIESATPPAAQQPAQTEKMAAPKPVQPAQPAAQQPAQMAAPKPVQPTQPAAQQPVHPLAPKRAQPTQPAAQQPAQTAAPTSYNQDTTLDPSLASFLNRTLATKPEERGKSPTIPLPTEALPKQPSSLGSSLSAPAPMNFTTRQGLTAAQQPAQMGPQYSSDPELAAVQRRMQELSKRRDQEFQNRPDITDSARTPRTTSFFNSKEYAQQFQAAQAAANQRAIDRIGAPRQDRGISTTLESSNRAAAAMKNAAKQPRVATAEQVRAAGFGPKQTERLLFTENVTPDYLERLKNRSLRNY